MVEEQQKRQVARKLWIRDLLAATYVKEEGTRPNHVLLSDNSKAARVNVLGIVVATEEGGLPTMVLDDGTGRIRVRAFEPFPALSAAQVGDAVVVVGRPRQYNNEMYLLPEIVRKLTDLGWLEVRKCELASTPLLTTAVPIAVPASQNVVTEESVDDSFGLAENVLGAIRALDRGDGADTEAVLAQVGIPDAEKTITFLLQNGDIFEVGPGRLKVLE